jgi:hypothetical protein
MPADNEILSDLSETCQLCNNPGMTNRPEPARLDTVRGTTRQIIGLTKNLATKAVGNPDLNYVEGEEALQVVQSLVRAYEDLLRTVKPNQPITSIITQYADAEQADYKIVKHSLRILTGLYGPQAADPS